MKKNINKHVNERKRDKEKNKIKNKKLKLSNATIIFSQYILSSGLLLANTSCGAQMIYGPGPSTWAESKSPSRGGLWSKLDKIAFGYRRGQVGPRQTQSIPQKEG